MTISIVIVVGSAITLFSFSSEDPVLIDELLQKSYDTYMYVEENTERGFTEREYSAVMRLANNDPDKAIEIFNDPEYPEKFYDKTRHILDG